MKTSPRLLLLIVVLAICLGGAAITLTDRASPADGSASSSETPDFSRPMPREEVLRLFKQLFAMPAEDYIHWDESVAAGKIPADVRAFHEAIVAFNAASDIDPATLSTDGLPFIDLPDGFRVYPVLNATLGPVLGANVSQEDLNGLLPDLADIQQRVREFEIRQAEIDQARQPVFTKVRLEPNHLAIAPTRDTPGAETIPVAVTEGDDPEIMHIVQPAPLDGRHVTGARITIEPYVSMHLELTEEGSDVLAKVTEAHTGGIFAILIGGKFHAAVAIGGPIKTRNLQLPGSFSEDEARALLDAWAVREDL